VADYAYAESVGEKARESSSVTRKARSPEKVKDLVEF
jgi:hypothetical protein